MNYSTIRGLILALVCLTAPLFSEPAPFIVYSCPKCGTHLLTKALRLLVGMEPQGDNLADVDLGCQLTLIGRTWNRYPLAHCWTKEALQEALDRGYKVIFHLRDPRDQIDSLYRWFLAGREGTFGYEAGRHALEMCRGPGQLEEFITGERFGWTPAEGIIGYSYRLITSLPQESWMMTRFEDLVGEKGGGDRDLQMQTLLDLAEFLEIEVSQERIEEIADQLFGSSWSFRKGQIGGHKKRFLPEQIAKFEEIHSSLLAELGYDLD